jgi:hypothetical protein
VTSKELVEAAEWITQGGLDPTTSEKLAEHILATVRADDDEPVTASWFAILLGSIDRFEFGRGYSVERNENGQWEAWLCGHCLRAIKTKGQFRQLCRGLGIALKEDR